MRKRKGGRKGDIIIDLTSLLDIVFIILLVVMCGQAGISQNLSDAMDKAEDAERKYMASASLYDDQNEIADNLNQYVLAVTVVVPYDEKDVTKREVRILKEGNTIESFQLVGNNISESRSAFKESLAGYAKENSDRPVILSLNEDDDYILYRDEVMVNEIFRELALEYSNIYIKGNVSEAKE